MTYIVLWGGPADGAELDAQVPKGSRLLLPDAQRVHVYSECDGLDQDDAQVFVYRGTEPHPGTPQRTWPTQPDPVFHVEHPGPNLWVVVLAASVLLLAILVAAGLLVGLVS